MRSVVKRSLAVGAVVAGVVSGGSGVAGAAPPSDPAGYRSTGEYARSLLVDGESGVSASINVTSFGGAAPTAAVTVYIRDHVCVATAPLQVTLVPLESATARGTVPLACTQEVGQGRVGAAGTTFSGTAEVQLTWTGVGAKIREVFTGNLMHCVGKIFERAATLDGALEVDVDDELLPGTITVTDYVGYTDTALRSESVVCPPALS